MGNSDDRHQPRKEDHQKIIETYRKLAKIGYRKSLHLERLHNNMEKLPYLFPHEAIEHEVSNMKYQWTIKNGFLGVLVNKKNLKEDLDYLDNGKEKAEEGRKYIKLYSQTKSKAIVDQLANYLLDERKLNDYKKGKIDDQYVIDKAIHKLHKYDLLARYYKTMEDILQSDKDFIPVRKTKQKEGAKLIFNVLIDTHIVKAEEKYLTPLPFTKYEKSLLKTILEKRYKYVTFNLITEESSEQPDLIISKIKKTPKLPYARCYMNEALQGKPIVINIIDLNFIKFESSKHSDIYYFIGTFIHELTHFLGFEHFFGKKFSNKKHQEKLEQLNHNAELTHLNCQNATASNTNTAYVAPVEPQTLMPVTHSSHRVAYGSYDPFYEDITFIFDQFNVKPLEADYDKQDKTILYKNSYVGSCIHNPYNGEKTTLILQDEFVNWEAFLAPGGNIKTFPYAYKVITISFETVINEVIFNDMNNYCFNYGYQNLEMHPKGGDDYLMTTVNTSSIFYIAKNDGKDVYYDDGGQSTFHFDYRLSDLTFYTDPTQKHLYVINEKNAKQSGVIFENYFAQKATSQLDIYDKDKVAIANLKKDNLQIFKGDWPQIF